LEGASPLRQWNIVRSALNDLGYNTAGESTIYRSARASISRGELETSRIVSSLEPVAEPAVQFGKAAGQGYEAAFHGARVPGLRSPLGRAGFWSGASVGATSTDWLDWYREYNEQQQKAQRLLPALAY